MLDGLLPPDRLTHIIERPATSGSFGPDLPLDPRIVTALSGRGISSLFTHQAEAIEAVRSGQDVLITTGTGSGKSLCYQIPILEMALREPRGRALLLFPTKALAQDQFQSLDQFLPGEGVGVATYDGDTPASARARVRKGAQIILTNPDMLHVGILPNHEPWQSFLRHLRYV
ncbi:MAG: DEAD/DEAH box helicase, partial [Fimbriimonadaceae bacterium]|nr:DEAD/DEAH box helicase [Fimbriimonadaceae bacterium]